MLDRFDISLLNLVQRDDSRTADELAEQVALSPSTIARRLRRLRGEGWIARTIALLSPRLTGRRLRAVVLLQLGEHADQRGKSALLKRIEETPQVQFCYELAGTFDLLLLFDCSSMAEFNEVAGAVLEADATVRRYETSFVKREAKFAPFAQLSPRDAPHWAQPPAEHPSVRVRRAVADEEGNVVVLAKGEAATKAGARYDNDYRSVMRSRDGRIVKVRECVDSALAERALGTLSAEDRRKEEEPG